MGIRDNLRDTCNIWLLGEDNPDEGENKLLKIWA